MFNLNSTRIKRAASAFYQALREFGSPDRPSLYLDRGSEETENIRAYDRLKMIALGRDLERNNAKYLNYVQMMKNLAFATCKAEIALDEYPEFSTAAVKDFNGRFSRDCMLKQHMNFQQFVQLVESARMREGDILISFDDWLMDSGKLLVWEADQIATVANWPRFAEMNGLGRRKDGVFHPFQNIQGVVLNEFGIVYGYTVTASNMAPDNPAACAIMEIPFDFAVFIPASDAVLVKHAFRFNECRGVSIALPVANVLHDIDAMIKSELSSAKAAAHWIAFLQRGQSNLSGAEMESMEAILNQLDSNEITSSASNTPAEDIPIQPPAARPDLQTLAERSGGLIQELEPGETANAPNFNRPNLNTNSFYNQLGDTAGAVFGLTSEYARGAVNSTYTSHRGETNITYRAIASRQKDAEWDYLDFILKKRVEWAARHELIPQPPVADWDMAAYWVMPTADTINPGSEEAAETASVKNGRKSLKGSMGADWKKKIDDTAEVLAYARSKGVPLAVAETVAGAVIPDTTQDEIGDTNESETGNQRTDEGLDQG